MRKRNFYHLWAFFASFLSFENEKLKVLLNGGFSWNFGGFKIERFLYRRTCWDFLSSFDWKNLNWRLQRKREKRAFSKNFEETRENIMQIHLWSFSPISWALEGKLKNKSLRQKSFTKQVDLLFGDKECSKQLYQHDGGKVSVWFKPSVLTSSGSLSLCVMSFFLTFFPSHLFLTRRTPIYYDDDFPFFFELALKRKEKLKENLTQFSPTRKEGRFVYLLIDRLLKLIESRTCNLFSFFCFFHDFASWHDLERFFITMIPFFVSSLRWPLMHLNFPHRQHLDLIFLTGGCFPFKKAQTTIQHHQQWKGLRALASSDLPNIFQLITSDIWSRKSADNLYQGNEREKFPFWINNLRKRFCYLCGEWDGAREKASRRSDDVLVTSPFSLFGVNSIR